jgi:hypothetical protein
MTENSNIIQVSIFIAFLIYMLIYYIVYGVILICLIPFSFFYVIIKSIIIGIKNKNINDIDNYMK